MAIKFHRLGFEHAARLIEAGEFTTFDSNWNEEKPTRDEVINFINSHTMNEYGLWFLGTNSQFPADSKEHYVYPHGDLKMIQQCGLADTLAKAQEKDDHEIVRAAQELLDMIDVKMESE